MEIFIDSTNLEEIKEMVDLGIVDGCTTNPKMFSKESISEFEDRVKEILKIVNGPVSVQVTSRIVEEMVQQALIYSSWGKNVVVKVPGLPEGFKALNILKQKGVKVNVTSCVTVGQALVSAKCNADYCSLLIGRIEDIGQDGFEVIKQSVNILNNNGFKTKIIVGSIRNVNHVIKSAMAGAHVITVPYKILKEMVEHAKTRETVEEFLNAWNINKNK